MKDMVTYYWHADVVYGASGTVMERGISWEAAQEKTQRAADLGRSFFGIETVRIVKLQSPKGGE